MKKKLFMIIIVFLCAFSMHTTAVHASEDVIPNDETGVPDEILYQSILSALEKKENETFTRQEAETVDWVSVSPIHGRICQSLKGIGCLVNLKQLDLRNVDQLEGMEELKHLEALDLSYASLPLKKQWKPLAELKSLKYLTISGCKVSSLKGTGIENLTNLKQLSAYECGLKKINELKNLKKLEVLYLDNNRLTDIKALKGLTNLKKLNLSGNRLNDVKEVKRFKKLEQLALSSNGLKNYRI